MACEIIQNGQNIRIDPTVKIIGNGTIILNERVQIRAYAVIEIDGTLEIGNNSVIGYHDFLQISGTMKIGNGTLVGPNTVLLASSHQITDIPLVKEQMIRSYLTIKDNVWIGANCTINNGITLETDCIIGANSFVNKDTMYRGIYGGTPAKLIRMR